MNSERGTLKEGHIVQHKLSGQPRPGLESGFYHIIPLQSWTNLEKRALNLYQRKSNKLTHHPSRN